MALPEMTDHSNGAPVDKTAPLTDRLLSAKPFDHLDPARFPDLSAALSARRIEAGNVIFRQGDMLEGVYLIETGAVDIFSDETHLVSHRGPGDVIGERGVLRDGRALLTAHVRETADVILIGAAAFRQLLTADPEFAAWFGVSDDTHDATDDSPYAVGLMAIQVGDLMSRSVLSCAPEATVQDVAKVMRDNTISSLLVMEETDLKGIVTVHDLVNKVLASGRGGDVLVKTIMTPDPITIAPDAVGLDALMTMADRRINHLPVADPSGTVVGLVGRTDLFRQQNATASFMASEIVAAADSAGMAQVMKRLPDLLSHLTAAGVRPAAISRRITDLTDAVTRRLLALAEAKFGAPPVPYVWAACGSQGRREQTGVSDQDNCLIISDDMASGDAAYFQELAAFVSTGLDDVGFVYCPGDMMATNPRWRQPYRVWEGYFRSWITEPDEEAQMLASVMFDLRPIAGEMSLFSDLQAQTLARAKKNSIFVRHMISNSLKHSPPLNFFRGLSLIRSGEHKNTVDLKHAGVVPIVDLGRVYALKGGLTALNTRERIQAAGAEGVLSSTGERDLLDAYDFIAKTRLNHQAAQIAKAQKPDNFLDPGAFSDLERNHLRDAFLVVKTMQSALAGLL